jgi:hypothetical protein
VRDAGLVVRRAAGRSDRRDGQQDRGARAGHRGGHPVVPGTTTRCATPRKRRGRRAFGYPCCSRRRPAAAGRGCASCASARGARRSLALAQRKREALRRRRGVRREVHRRPAPRRDPGARRPARHHAAPGRARVLGAAPAPEDDRGSAQRRRDAGAARAHGRGAVAARAARAT